MTREQIRAALTDEHALTCTVFAEAAGEPMGGQIAVACVIRNRAQHPRHWGTDYRSVCLKPDQFSCWWMEGENTDRCYAIAEALIRKEPIGERTMLSQIRWIAQGVLWEQLPDVSRGADHYLTKALFESEKCPSWARNRVPVLRVGGHCFLRLEL